MTKPVHVILTYYRGADAFLPRAICPDGMPHHHDDWGARNKAEDVAASISLAKQLIQEAQLRPEWLEACRLRYVMEFTNGETAKIMRRSRWTIERYLDKAHVALERQIAILQLNA